MKRKTFSGKFKIKVAIEALKGHRTINEKGHRTINEIAAEFDVHPTQVNYWRKTATKRLSDNFQPPAREARSGF
jgi:transposase-like protein